MKPDFKALAREIIFDWEPEGDLTCATDCDALNSYDALGAAIATQLEKAFELGVDSVTIECVPTGKARIVTALKAPTPGERDE